MAGYIVQKGFEAERGRGHITVSPSPDGVTASYLLSLLYQVGSEMCALSTREEGAEYVFGPTSRGSVEVASVRTQDVLGILGHTAVSSEEIHDLPPGIFLFDYRSQE